MKCRPAIASVVLICLTTFACVKKPVTAPRAVVPETVSSELRVAGTAAKEFGDMVAVGVGCPTAPPRTM